MMLNSQVINHNPSATSVLATTIGHPAMQTLLASPCTLIRRCDTPPHERAGGNQVTSNFSDMFLFAGDGFLVFEDFQTALDHGRQKAHSIGFHLRIKTASHNGSNGTTFKYICCSREGSPNNASGANSRQKRSLRCGCPWTCKLVGLHVRERLTPTDWLHLEAVHGTAVHQWDTLWYYDYANKPLNHNHELDSFGSPDGQSNGSLRLSPSSTVSYGTPNGSAGESTPSLRLSGPAMHQVSQARMVTASTWPSYSSATPCNGSLAYVAPLNGRLPLDGGPQSSKLPVLEPSVSFHVRSVNAHMGVEWKMRYSHH